MRAATVAELAHPQPSRRQRDEALADVLEFSREAGELLAAVEPAVFAAATGRHPELCRLLATYHRRSREWQRHFDKEPKS